MRTDQTGQPLCKCGRRLAINLTTGRFWTFCPACREKDKRTPRRMSPTRRLQLPDADDPDVHEPPDRCAGCGVQFDGPPRGTRRYCGDCQEAGYDVPELRR